MEWLSKEELKRARISGFNTLETLVTVKGEDGTDKKITVKEFLHTDMRNFRYWFKNEVDNGHYFDRASFRYVHKVMQNYAELEPSYVEPINQEMVEKLVVQKVGGVGQLIEVVSSFVRKLK